MASGSLARAALQGKQQEPRLILEAVKTREAKHQGEEAVWGRGGAWREFVSCHRLSFFLNQDDHVPMLLLDVLPLFWV